MAVDAKKSLNELRRELRRERNVKKIQKVKLKFTIEANSIDDDGRPYFFIDSNGYDCTPLPIESWTFDQLDEDEIERVKNEGIKSVLMDAPLELPMFSQRSKMSRNFSIYSLQSVPSRLASLQPSQSGPDSTIEMFRKRLQVGQVTSIDSWELPERDKDLIYKGITSEDPETGDAPTVQNEDVTQRVSRASYMAVTMRRKRWQENESQFDDNQPAINSSEDLTAPSMFRIREDPPPANRPVERTFSIMLRETDTIALFSVESKTAYRGTPEADAYLVDAERYRESVNISKTLISAVTQTTNMASTTDGTCTSIFKRNNQSTMTTLSDVEDVLLERKNEVIDDEYEDRNGQVDAIRAEKVLDQDSDSDISDSEEQNPDKIFSGADFRLKTMLLERVIAQNNLKNRQALFLGKYLPDPMGERVPFKYRLGHLWTYRAPKCYGKPVTSFSVNSVGDEILAVSYGEFKYDDTIPGVICLWNIKNPYQPERSYHFDSGVTYVEFSMQHPHIIGVAFSTGYVSIMDVSRKHLKVVCHNNGTEIFAFQPVWQMRWFVSDEGDEVPVSCSNNGRITYFRKDSTFAATNLLCVPRREGVLKGVRLLKKKCLNEIPLPKRPAVFCLAPHPTDPDIYLAGTEDGAVHKCSINYLHEHLDAFAAHNGPVYNIQFHPVCENIFLTCGADYRVRIWAYGVDLPLLELVYGKYPIQYAVWSPANPIVIVSVGADMIDIWDIRRKLTMPVSRFKTRLNCRLTRVCFCNSGHNIYVGDVMGNVQVFVLKNMPFDPEFKKEALADALKRALRGQETALEALKKLGPPFDCYDAD